HFFLPLLPSLENLILYVVAGMGLLGMAALGLRHQPARVRVAVVCIGLLPVVILFAAALLLNVHVYQYRAFLFAVFPVNLMMACWLVRLAMLRSRMIAATLLIGIMVAQAAMVFERIWPVLVNPMRGSNYRKIVQEVQPHLKPE